MRNSTLMVVFLLLGLVCWVGLIYLVNSTYPDSRAQYTFLAIWAAAVVLTATPLSYLFHQRVGRSLGRSGDLARAVRQGLLAAIATRRDDGPAVAGLLAAGHGAGAAADRPAGGGGLCAAKRACGTRPTAATG